MKTTKTKKPNIFWLQNNKKMFCIISVTVGLLLAFNCTLKAQTNTAYGTDALKSITTGNWNSAFGYRSLFYNTTGSFNTANGYNALAYNTTGEHNTANGVNALLSNTAGSFNVANGENALGLNSTGVSNTANGHQALYLNKTGSSNTSNGSQSLFSNTTGEQNTADGTQALHWNTIGKYNTAAGYRALFSNTTENYNTALGYNADVAAGFNNSTAIGANAKATTSNTIQLGNNAVTKVYAGVDTTATLIAGTLQTNSGEVNTGIKPVLSIKINKQKAGRIDENNAFYGYQSGSNFTTGNNNTSIGSKSLYTNTSGGNNTASGVNALYANTDGNNNTANGRAALYSNTTGQGNTASGESALYNNTIGSFNTASGVNTLVNNITGNNNTALGFAANVSKDSLTNATAIGYGAIVDSSNKIRLGNAMVEKVETQFKYTTVSDGRFKNKISQEDIKGLVFIKKLRPVAYNFDTRKFQEHITQNMPSLLRKQYMNQDFSASTAVRRSGFIAQEVEKAAEEVGYDFDGVSKPQDASGNYSLAYSQFVVPLVKAVQELSQKDEQKNVLIEQQEKKIEEQKQINQQLQQQLKDQQQQIDELKQLMKGANILATSKPSSESSSQELHLFPNPTTGVFTIVNNHTTNATIEVYDRLGNSVKKEMLANIKSGYKLDLSGYAKGTYWVNIISGNKKYTKQIVVQ